MIKAKEKAERADQAKNLFLGSMSHELRTPLNAILGLTQQLTWDEEEVARRRLFQTVTRSARELDLILTNLLEASQLEAGSQPLIRMTEVNLQVIVADVLDVISVVAAQKQLAIQVHWNPPSTNWFLQLDSLRIRQILLNLLTNAVKYTREGRVDLRFRISELPADGSLEPVDGPTQQVWTHQLELVVQDTVSVYRVRA